MSVYEEERISELEELGLKYSIKENAYLLTGTTIYVPMIDITYDDDKVFEKRLKNIITHINKLKNEK